jgi:hypothetical protein
MYSKNKFSVIGLAIFASIYLFACASQPITYRYDRDKDEPMHEHTTFNVVTPDEETIAQMDIKNPAGLKIIEETIIERMESRNYTQSDDPDLWVTYFVTGKDFQKAQANTVSVGVGFGGYYGGVGMNTANTNIKYFDYREGTLIIDFYNRDNKLVWHGIAKGSYEVDKTDVKALTEHVVKKIFQYYKYKVKVPKDKP